MGAESTTSMENETMVHQASTESTLSGTQRGRPRVYPIDETATERVNRSVANLLLRGGARRTFRLSPEANAALLALRSATGKTNDTAVIEDVLIKAAKALQSTQRLKKKK